MSNFDSKKTEKPLYLDIGNTSIKGAFRKGVNWESVHPKGVSNASELLEWIERHPTDFDGVVVSSVRPKVTQALEHELTSLPVRVLTIDDVPPERLDYETPKTLGIDRFLSCYGAITQTDKAAVVIDAGTACTIDFMTQDEIFWGGVIVPGFGSFSELLKEKAPLLPEVRNQIPDTWPGKSTEDAIKWGISGFYRDGILGALTRYREELDDFELFLTGGNATDIQKVLDMEVKVRPFLVFEGMERMI